MDLTPATAGYPLTEFIGFDSNRFDGELLDENSLDEITKTVYNKLLREPNLRIKNSGIYLVLYTLCKIENVIY